MRFQSRFRAAERVGWLLMALLAVWPGEIPSE
jgi:hypothetical protein